MVEKIITVAPRGFCAGVARSIKVVEDCLELFGAPVYIKHAIVHNKTVVTDLEARGAVTVELVEDIPDGAVAVFSAHGSPPSDYDKAKERDIRVIDATCPLVTKVHMEMHHFAKEGCHVVYIGHKGHVEGLGVIGEAEQYGIDVPVIENVDDVIALPYDNDAKIAYLTQTTLSIDETRDIIAGLKERFHNIIEPPTQDICYATTNRQEAIRKLAAVVDVIIVVGSQTSSNSNRLREVAEGEGCAAYLVDAVDEIQSLWVEGVKHIGVSAGASAPEYRVQEIVDYFIQQNAIHEELRVADEKMRFTEPVELKRARESL